MDLQDLRLEMYFFIFFFMQSQILHNLVLNSSLKNNRGTSVSP